MIRLTDAVLLASTKLKTRKIRLFVTIVVTSLLFSVLGFMAIVTEGTVQSLKSFGQEGYGDQFYVQATPLTYQMSMMLDQEIKDKFLPEQKKIVADKKAAAKKLGIEYDEKADQNYLPMISMQNGPNSTEYYPNYMHPSILQYMQQKNVAIPGTTFAEFTAAARKAGAATTYSGTNAGNGFMGPSQSTGAISVLVDGKEDLKGDSTSGQGMYGMGMQNTKGVASITALGWRNINADLLLPFVLSGQTAVTGKDGSLPVIAPYSAAEEMLGLKALPQTATAAQKKARLAAVRERIAGKTAQLCYRNSASVALVEQAGQQLKDIENNKNNKEYTKPALLYALPTVACGETTIQSDKRTAEEKKQAVNQKTFDEQFGQYHEPKQGIITIRIIGINPDVEFGPSLNPASVLTSLLTSSTGTGWVSPTKALEQHPLALEFQGGTAATVDRSRVVYYAQFNTFRDMERFIKSQECKNLVQMQGPTGMVQTFDPSNTGRQTQECINQAKVFSVQPYGNSAGAVEQFKETIWDVAKYVILAIVTIAALVMMGNIGKIIADSRRETAVFRALGAKKLDIAEIYIVYTILLSMLIALSGLMIGFLGAVLLNNKYTTDLSVSAVIAYNAKDLDKEFTLFGLNPLYMMAITGLVILAGLLSAMLPLMANTRRNPIGDMRDEG